MSLARTFAARYAACLAALGLAIAPVSAFADASSYHPKPRVHHKHKAMKHKMARKAAARPAAQQPVEVAQTPAPEPVATPEPAPAVVAEAPAAPAAPAQAAAPLQVAKHGKGTAIALLGVAAVIGGIVLASDNNKKPVSP